MLFYKLIGGLARKRWIIMKIIGKLFLLVLCIQYNSDFCPCRDKYITSLRKENAICLRIGLSTLIWFSEISSRSFICKEYSKQIVAEFQCGITMLFVFPEVHVGGVNNCQDDMTVMEKPL